MRHKDTYNKILNTLCCSYETGEGAVNLSEKFVSQNILFQCDVIGDWIHDLEFYREMVLLGPTDEEIDQHVEDLKKQGKIIDLAKHRVMKKDKGNDAE